MKLNIFPCFFVLFSFVGIMTDGSHLTQLGTVKQEIQDLKSGFESLINQL